MIPRTRHRISKIDEQKEGEYHEDDANERNEPVDKDFGNTISSRIVGTDTETPDDGTTWKHAPVLDLDFPAMLVPSSTPGHFHLYLDKVMTWPEYEQLLEALEVAHVLEPGYVSASRARRATFVRDPEKMKPRFKVCEDVENHDPHLWMPGDGYEYTCVGRGEEPF